MSLHTYIVNISLCTPFTPPVMHIPFCSSCTFVTASVTVSWFVGVGLLSFAGDNHAFEQK